MAMENEVKDPLPHHEQQNLCTSRLPYRQGRKLTAVKVYTINTESNHLLIFGVPSINLRQETKSLFMKFGKITRFSLHKDYKCEIFTETFHAVFENIKSARIAKKMLDTKNFYGSNLHVCYAPELETVKETSSKLFQRKKDVLSRLKNLKKEEISTNNQISAENSKIPDTSQNLPNIPLNQETTRVTLNMGNKNIIYLNNNKRNLKPDNESASKKKSKLQYHNASANNHNYNVEINNAVNEDSHTHNESINNHYASHSNDNFNDSVNKIFPNLNEISNSDKANYNHNASSNNDKAKYNHNESSNNDNIEIIDFTSTEKETISNINEALNYNKFGNEIIKKVENKPLNVIKFNFNKKT